MLDGGIAELFADVFGNYYLDARLYHVTTAAGVGGKLSRTEAEYDCKAQPERTTDAMRRAEGYTTSDIAILVLSHTVGRIPTTADEIAFLEGAYSGQRWLIKAVETDSAHSHYVLHAQVK